ncbi:cell wall-associated NlpC family hydrolase [Modestobacter versicolor]|uniref:Cell wall-associated NlpC family hydrolase n=3 Tax=Modestobacter versicolor TaxID=429133 RepID=A0A839Y109_9ACTN|nr:NlpC/P60 family protein [Modestobacter versicolor]MBB3676459.1 cell wall-associated NlpC family hydrolase [Modestobacter versicolor]
MGTQATTRRQAADRSTRRLAGLVAAAAVCLVAVPATAAAAPTSPSDTQISQAQQAQADAAAQVGAISAALADAQVQVDAARARSAIALDAFQGKQAEHEAAQVAAQAAAAAAEQARADLADARADIAAFARQSYLQGSTSPTLEALMTADGPAQMVERAALLEAAGSHQGDVVVQVTAAEQSATAADAAAQTALGQAAALEQEAADALAAAEALEVSARSLAAGLAGQQAAMQQQLQQAQQALLGLEGARAAAQQYATQQYTAQQAAASRAATAQHPVTSGSAGTATTAGAGQASAVETAIAAAREHLGTIYAWGGGSLSGPSVGWGVDAGIVGFDCSGLTRYAYAQAGISIPRNSSAQYSALPKVSRTDLERGDLVFWATDTSRPSTIHHVAIYLGNGQILEAPQSGSVIRVTSMRWSGFIGGARPSA